MPVPTAAPPAHASASLAAPWRGCVHSTLPIPASVVHAQQAYLIRTATARCERAERERRGHGGHTNVTQRHARAAIGDSVESGQPGDVPRSVVAAALRPLQPGHHATLGLRKARQWAESADTARYLRFPSFFRESPSLPRQHRPRLRTFDAMMRQLPLLQRCLQRRRGVRRVL